jgi:hypothetical protein
LEEVGCNQRLVWTVKTDLKLHKTIGDLLAFIRQSPFLNPNLSLEFFNGTQSIQPEEPLIHLNMERNLDLRYPAPANPSSQQLVQTGQSKSSVVLRIDGGQTVQEVKYAVLSEIGRTDILASAVSLRLFDCEFVDGELFCAYGVPENSRITVSDVSDAVSVIRVRCESRIRDFRFRASDTIQELQFALQWHRGKESPPLALRNAAKFLSDGEFLSVIGSSLIQLFELFQFRSENESVSLPMQADATLRYAAASLAEQLKIREK